MSKPAISNGLETSGAALELHDVVRVFEGNIRALDGVSLQIEPGEFVAITGTSGCGKSTLLHLVGALDVPTSGTVSVGGYNLPEIRDLSRFRREEVGIVFQMHNLLPHQPVHTNIEVAMVGTKLSRAERRARALELLEEVDLGGREDRHPTQLSGGERQRVAIARALANRPRLLLADEPTGSLDSETSGRVLDLVQRVHATGVTVLMVTHDREVAAQADRTVEMKDGKIMTAGAQD